MQSRLSLDWQLWPRPRDSRQFHGISSSWVGGGRGYHRAWSSTGSSDSVASVAHSRGRIIRGPAQGNLSPPFLTKLLLRRLNVTLSGSRSVGLLNEVSVTPARPSVAKASHTAPSNRLATVPRPNLTACDAQRVSSPRAEANEARRRSVDLRLRELSGWDRGGADRGPATECRPGRLRLCR